MQNNTQRTLIIKRMLVLLWAGLMITSACAGTPLWTFEPLTPTTIAVPANGAAVVQYRVTNQSSRPHTLTMQPLQGITQITTGLGVCKNPFVLQSKNACVLSLQINGSQLSTPIIDGPVVCQQNSTFQCYRPSITNILHITQASPIVSAVIAVTGSPLTLTVNGSTGQLTITNTSLELAATNIASNFTATALNGKVTETGNTCASVPPGGSCTLTYTPGNTIVPQTNFTIQGTNTNVLTAAIAIQSGSTLTTINPSSGTASGGTGVTLTGTGLLGATAVTFGGISATSINIVNSTTITAVTPAHAIGAVDVVIDTPVGGATLVNGYTYLTTAVGQPSGGGIIACLNGGLNNLIAAAADNSASIAWGGSGTAIGAGAQSNTNGATNTAAIVSSLGAGVYAAQLCNDFEVDSQGNTPCEAGNACYSDWFLPAGNNTTASGQTNCVYTNRVAIGGFSNHLNNFYWTSTEYSIIPASGAYKQDFNSGAEVLDGKANPWQVRCVRAFTP